MEIDWDRLVAMTESDIRSAAAQYNADFPEAGVAIAAGSVEIRVITLSGDTMDRTMRVIASAGVVAEGAFIGAGAPVVIAAGLRKCDGRLTPLQEARRVFGKRLSRARVPVRWMER